MLDPSFFPGGNFAGGASVLTSDVIYFCKKKKQINIDRAINVFLQRFIKKSVSWSVRTCLGNIKMLLFFSVLLVVDHFDVLSLVSSWFSGFDPIHSHPEKRPGDDLGGPKPFW